MKKYYLYGGIVIVIIAAIFLIQNGSAGDVSNKAPSEDYSEFAQCITNSGALFYGAYWCSHCQDQKEMFGDAADALPYVECSLPGNANSVTQECKDAGITGYPTWVFADNSRASGTLSFQALSDATGCSLTGNNSDANTNTETIPSIE